MGIPFPHLVKFPPFYGGPWGIPGAESPLGIRTHPTGVSYYVDANHALANDSNDGTNPDAPLLTIGAAVGKVSNNGDQIFVYPGMYTESIYISDYTAYPSYVEIIGLGHSFYGVQWDSGDAADPCLILGAVGWRVRGIRFYVPASTTALVLPCTQAPYAANDIGIRTVIENCYFDGSVNNGQAGIDLHGAPYDVHIIGNQFAFLSNLGGTAAGIVSTNTGYADAYRAHILGNSFYENDIHVDASLNVSEVLFNRFNADGAIATATVLDLRGGTQGENLVMGNFFAGDYSNLGGYWANAGNPGSWSGNLAEDEAEAEVDGAMTIGVPT